MEEDKKIIEQRRKNFTIFSLIFLVGFLGGIFGSFLYLDFKGFQIESRGGTGLSNLRVQEESGIIDVAQKASRSVVSITGVQEREDFFGNTREARSSGTGFIATADGLIVTNKHVVADPSARYSVFLNDGREFEAEIKATDPSNDLAFIKINARDLPVLEMGNSDDIKVGQRVVAIGNALGQYQNSVTAGVISGTSRAIQAGDRSGTMTETLDDVIQTDAAINPGNSGGPLVNLAGQAIGINTAVDQQGQAIGFAIPINVARSALESVLVRGRIVRPMLGIRYIPITKEFATRNDLSVNEGAFVYGGPGNPAIVPGSPAAIAGLRQRDIITAIGRDKVTTSQGISSILRKHKVGDEIEITYLRDGKENKTRAILQESRQ